ncbi:hypothetical protein F4778DRAFT_286687 [Xylariomycetidae sp. FL2044]|nr:hypothetical protein F4778DRAFT_286687 [Xylariomycetidae sp. FL2044]
MAILPLPMPSPQLFSRQEVDGGNGAETTTTTSLSGCTTAIPGPNGHVPLDACNSYYNYDPQSAPAVAVAVIFGVLTCLHIVLAILYRKRYAWVLIMGGLWETIAFVLHSLGARDQQQVGYATAWQILFLLAPLWINAFVYMTFARVAWFFSSSLPLPLLPSPSSPSGPQHQQQEQQVQEQKQQKQQRKIFGIKPASLAKYFVWADVLTFVVQAAGARVIQIGLDVYLAGMGVQQAFILLFLALMVVFHVRATTATATAPVVLLLLREREEEEASSTTGVQEPFRQKKQQQPSWLPLQIALYAVLALITVRIIYRICEFAGGITPSNPVPFHEEYSYALDCLPMMLALVILAVWHPGRTLVGPESEFPTKKSRAEKKAEKQRKSKTKQNGQSYDNIVDMDLQPRKYRSMV